jgi:hypothetical protein
LPPIHNTPSHIDMFKRVEKRRRKKEEEEELGLDEDMKEVLGLQDTDSDESDTDSDSDSEQTSDAGVVDAVEDIGGSGEEGGEGEGRKAGNAEISVEDALADPVYLVSLEPDIKGCIVCPGKLLKHPKMIEVHKASNVCTWQFQPLVHT